PDLSPGLLVLRGADVATTPLDDQLHVEPALGVQGRELELRVVHRDARRRLNVPRGDVARTLLAQVHADRLVVLGADAQLLDVQDELDHVLLDAGDRGELVQYAVNLDAGDRRTRNRAEQGTPQRVAERVTEARLERLNSEPGSSFADWLLGEGRPLGDEHVRLLVSGRPPYDARATEKDATAGRAGGEIRRPAPDKPAPGPAMWPIALLRVELDDKLLLDLRVDGLPGRKRMHQNL